MSSIADALKRAQQERERLKGMPPAISGSGDAAQPAAATPEPSLASVVLRRTPAVDAPQQASTAARLPATPLASALRQAPLAPPPSVRNEQLAAETIVEDYASKRNLNLPAAMVVYHDRSGPIAEQYRKIRDALMAAHFHGAGAASRREAQSLVITSTRPGEGKTVSLLNLALSLVEIRANRVLLIDGNLHPVRHSSLTTLLHLQREQGLAELLAAPTNESFEPYIHATPWHNLHVLPSGALTTPEAAAGLLQSPNLRALLRHAGAGGGGNFDWVLIDAPAASAFPDAGLLGSVADGVLMAVALHHTPHAEVQTTLRRLKSMNLPVKSCILTKA
jgi:Mrp family chromosome partitioning ATPase